MRELFTLSAGGTLADAANPSRSPFAAAVAACADAGLAAGGIVHTAASLLAAAAGSPPTARRVDLAIAVTADAPHLVADTSVLAAAAPQAPAPALPSQCVAVVFIVDGASAAGVGGGERGVGGGVRGDVSPLTGGVTATDGRRRWGQVRKAPPASRPRRYGRVTAAAVATAVAPRHLPPPPPPPPLPPLESPWLLETAAGAFVPAPATAAQGRRRCHRPLKSLLA